MTSVLRQSIYLRFSLLITTFSLQSKSDLFSSSPHTEDCIYLSLTGSLAALKCNWSLFLGWWCKKICCQTFKAQQSRGFKCKEISGSALQYLLSENRTHVGSFLVLLFLLKRTENRKNLHWKKKAESITRMQPCLIDYSDYLLLPAMFPPFFFKRHTSIINEVHIPERDDVSWRIFGESLSSQCSDLWQLCECSSRVEWAGGGSVSIHKHTYTQSWSLIIFIILPLM